MSHPVENLQRFGLKVFLEPDATPEARALIPVFHRWIQTAAVDGLLIDVADYTHLVDGPSVLLVGYEGNYVLDYTDGRPGLAYYQKQPAGGSLADRLVVLSRTLFKASILLETDQTVGAQCRFRGDKLQFVANDRLFAPPNDETVAALLPVLTDFLHTVFQETKRDVTDTTQVGDRLRLTLRSTHNAPVKNLLDRIY